MKSTIFIPKKIKVGFNIREDTYTKKLGYVIYHDGKVWRKESSWESWRFKYMSYWRFCCLYLGRKSMFWCDYEN